MIGSKFQFFDADQIRFLRDKVLTLLETHGVRLDEHEEMFGILAQAGALTDKATRIVRFPRSMMEKFIALTPKKLKLGSRTPGRVLEVPRPDGTFYSRTNTGGHGWIDPETNEYSKITTGKLADWAKLINRLEEISFLPYLFPHDVPVETADVHALATLMKHTDKHIWVQPYSPGSVEHLLKLGETLAGGRTAFQANPVISMIACSLTPREFKSMDLDIILRSARAGAPIHACSLPGAGGTAPITLPGVIILAAAEILAMLAMAQAVSPGTPFIACPIIFATDMKNGRSLQSSVEALRAASGAVQFLKAAFNLPTHNYGLGSDAPNPGQQSQAERAMLGTLMSLSGLDIFGGAGQLEVATAVSPLQLIIDNELVGMMRRMVSEFTLDDENLALDVIAETDPGQHFMTAGHTFKHCREGFQSRIMISQAREIWDRKGAPDLLDRARDRYRALMAQENECLLAPDMAAELTTIVQSADRALAG